MKILGGIGIAVGSIGAVAAAVGTGGFALPLVVMAAGSAGVMFGTSDTVEGINDIAASITGEGLDQRSYNPIRDDAFGGNELVYAVSEMGVSLTTSALASKALVNASNRLVSPKISATKHGVRTATREIEATILNYKSSFEDSLANDFNKNYEIRNTIENDMILVQFSSDAPNASLRYWTTVDEANYIPTVEEYMDKMALSREWGSRNVVKVARLKAGTEVKHAIGTAKAQPSLIDPRPGGGRQVLFNTFDTRWITEIRKFDS